MFNRIDFTPYMGLVEKKNEELHLGGFGSIQAKVLICSDGVLNSTQCTTQMTCFQSDLRSDWSRTV